MRKRIAAAVLAGCLVLALLSVQALAFSDVSRGAWYADAVRYVEENGLMGGTGNGRFDPNGTVSRGMLVTILYRMDGAPGGYSRTSFADVKRGSYYEAAIAWASANGIVTGYGSTRFAPDAPVTREQFAAILYRYADYKGAAEPSGAGLSQYDDYPRISAYAIPAMRWANENGFITGASRTTLSPKGTTTRAQTAAIIMRYLQWQTDGLSEEESAQPEDESPVKRPEQNKPASSDSPEIVVGSMTAKQGEQVVVDIDLANNPGILGMTLSVSYDSRALTLTAAESGDALDGVLTFMPAKNLKNGCSFVWYGTALASSQIKDGCILRLTFEVGAAASGTYPIVITASKDDLIDADLNAVSVSITNGAITVK